MPDDAAKAPETIYAKALEWGGRLAVFILVPGAALYYGGLWPGPRGAAQWPELWSLSAAELTALDKADAFAFQSEWLIMLAFIVLILTPAAGCLALTRLFFRRRFFYRASVAALQIFFLLAAFLIRH